MSRVPAITDVNTYVDKDPDPNPIPIGEELVYAGRAEFQALKDRLSEHASAINAMDNERRLLVSQVAHGFTLPSSIPIPVYFNGASWVQADRTVAASLRSAYIVAIEDVDSFWVQIDGFHELNGGHGLTDLTVYYLTDTSPAHTATKPTTGIIQALWEVLGDRVRLLSDPARLAVTATPDTKQEIFFPETTESASRSLTDADCGKVIWVDATLGAVILTLPHDVSAGFNVVVYKVDASANAVTVNGSGGMTIKGGPAVADEWTTTTQWAGISLVRHSATVSISEGRT